MQQGVREFVVAFAHAHDALGRGNMEKYGTLLCRGECARIDENVRMLIHTSVEYIDMLVHNMFLRSIIYFQANHKPRAQPLSRISHRSVRYTKIAVTKRPCDKTTSNTYIISDCAQEGTVCDGC